MQDKEPSSLIWRGILSKDKENSFEWELINGTGIGKASISPYQERFLRITTHGRGMWERQLDIESYNDVC
jgi:hypothetical protein